MPAPWELNWETPKAAAPPGTQAPPKELQPWEMNWAVPQQEYKREPVPATLPEDPFERAALRTRRTVSTPRDPNAPLAQLPTKAIEAVKSADEQAKGLLTGTIEPTPENVLPAVAATINPAARGTAAAIASVAGRRGAAPAAVAAETALPKYAEGGWRGTAAERLAGVPFVGKPVREAAARPLGEFDAQVAAADKAAMEHFGQAETAATRPTGSAPDLTKAGNILAQGARDQRAFVSPRGEVTGLYEQRTTLAPKLEAMISSQGRPENNIGRVIAMAGAGEGKAADFRTLAELRKNINGTDWRHVEGAAFTKLGEVPAEGASGVIRSVEFDPITALRNYDALPEGGRRILFGGPNAPFRTHLDSLVADTKSLDALSERLTAQSTLLNPLRQIPQGSTISGKIEAGLAASSALVHPLAALGTIVGARLLASMISKPQTAAALAQWSKAYVLFFQSGGSPGAMAALKIATNNLRNASGEDIDAEKLVEAMRGSSSVPINTVKVRKNDGIPSSTIDPGSLSPYWGQDLKGIQQTTTRLAPGGIPWESMRRSQNVEMGRQPPFSPPNTYLDTPEQRHDWAVRNIPGYQEQTDRFAREATRERAIAGPPGSLSRAAGLADLEAQSRRPAVPSYESVVMSGRGPFVPSPSKPKSKEKRR